MSHAFEECRMTGMQALRMKQRQQKRVTTLPLVSMASCADKVWSKRSPKPCPDEADSGQVLVCTVHQTLERVHPAHANSLCQEHRSGSMPEAAQVFQDIMAT